MIAHRIEVDRAGNSLIGISEIHDMDVFDVEAHFNRNIVRQVAARAGLGTVGELHPPILQPLGRQPNPLVPQQLPDQVRSGILIGFRRRLAILLPHAFRRRD